MSSAVRLPPRLHRRHHQVVNDDLNVSGLGNVLAIVLVRPEQARASPLAP
jgi:hypothetical protein